MIETESRLWHAWREGADGEAFSALVEPHVGFAVDFARRLGCGPSDADEVVQRCLVRLAAEGHDTPVRVGVRAWLGRSVVSEARMLFRARGRRSAHEARAVVERPQPDDPLERRDEVEAALSTLDEEARRLLELRFLHDLEYREVAFIVGGSALACRLRVHRALQRLRRRLGRTAPLVLAAGTRLRGEASPGTTVARALAAVGSPPRAGTATAATAAVGGGLVMGQATKATTLALGVAALCAVLGGVMAWWHPWDRGDDGRAPELASGPSAGASGPSDGAAALAARPGAARPGPQALPSTAVARGRVTRSDGTPIAGASVTAVPRETGGFVVPAGMGGSPTAKHVATTDADGRFQVSLEEGESRHELLVAADGFGPAIVGPLRAGSETAVVLSGGAVWTGRVRDGGGAAVAGAKVGALVLCSWFRVERTAASDGAGRFRIDGLPEHTARLRLFTAWIEASAEGFAPTTVKPEFRPGLPVTDVEVVLRRGSKWTGRVVDGDTASPLAGTEVDLVSMEARARFSTETGEATGRDAIESPFADRLLARATTDADGRWTLDRVPCLDGPRPVLRPGEPDLRPWAGRLEVRRAGYVTRAEVLRRVEEGAEGTIDLVLWHGGTVSGRVVRADGTPVVGAAGLVTTPEPAASWTRFVTDGEGHYVAADVVAPSKEGAEATVSLPRVAQAPKVTVRVRAGAVSVAPDVVVPRPTEDGIAVDVLVVDERGAPIEGAIVRWIRNARAAGRTGPEGRISLRIPRVRREAEVEFAARAEGYAEGTATRGPDVLGKDEVRIVLPTGRRLEGRVLYADGRPAGGAYVTAVPVGPPPAPRPGDDPEARPPPFGVFAEADGTFQHVDLPAGDWTLRASPPVVSTGGGFTLKPPTVSVGPVHGDTTDVVLRLPPTEEGPTAQVRGSVVDGASGAPVNESSVTLTRGEDLVVARREAAGRFVADGLPIGTWDLAVTAPGYRRQTVKGVSVAAGGPAAGIEVRLVRGSTITGRAIGGPEGGEGRELWWWGAGGAGGGAPVAADGRFQTIGLEPGAYLVSWAYPSVADEGRVRAFAVAGRVVVPETDAAIDLTLVPAGGLSVTVEDPGLPLAGATEEVSADARARSKASTLAVEDAEGHVLLSRNWIRRGRSGGLDRVVLAPGHYRVRLERPGTAPVVVDVDVTEGEHVRRTIGG